MKSGDAEATVEEGEPSRPSPVRRSLAVRIAATVALPLLLLMLGVAGITYDDARRDAFEERDRLADVISYAVETALAGAPRGTLQHVVEDYGLLADVSSIAVADRRGVVLASTEPKDLGDASKSSLMLSFVSGTAWKRASHRSLDQFVVLEPLYDRDASGATQTNPVAALEISFRVSRIERNAMRNAMVPLGVSFAGLALFLVWLTLVLRRLVTQRVARLSEAADRLRCGDHAVRAKLGGGDEIGRLSGAFDAMADRLDNMVRGLEGEVASRTSALSAQRTELARRKELLELLFVVTATANQAASVECALAEAMEEIGRVTGWPLGHVFLASPDAPPKAVPTKIRYAHSADVLDARLTRLLADPKGVGLVDDVIQTGVHAWVEEVDEEVDPKTQDVLYAAIAFPILVGTRAVGALLFLAPKASLPDAQLLEVMENVGAQLGRVIERRHVERLKDEFVSIVSHELRTPLAAIRGSLGLLAHGVLGELQPDASEAVCIAHESCERLVRLINDLLDMQQLATGSMQMHVSVQPIAPVLARVLKSSEPSAASFGITLSLVDEAEGARVAMDAERITQVLSHLISNAVKFSPAGNEVIVKARYVGELVRVEVCDRGVGVPEAFRARIFERFTQNDSSSTRQVGGTGLGLAVSKAIIEQHGGKIGFVDQDGGGTIFYFELSSKSEKLAGNA